MSCGGPNDTHPEIEKMLIEGYRRMSAQEKMDRVSELNRTIQRLALSDIRERHPEADEREQMLRLASRWLEPELMLKAFGWDVEKEGY